MGEKGRGERGEEKGEGGEESGIGRKGKGKNKGKGGKGEPHFFVQVYAPGKNSSYFC